MNATAMILGASSVVKAFSKVKIIGKVSGTWAASQEFKLTKSLPFRSS